MECEGKPSGRKKPGSGGNKCENRKLLLAINEAFEELQSRKRDFDAKAVKELLQGSMETQMTLLRLFDRLIEEQKSRIGIDVSASSMSTYHYARLTLGDFINKKYKMNDIAFGALNEQFIREYQAYTEEERGYSNQTTRHYLALLKKVCRIAYKEGLSENGISCISNCPNRKKARQRH